MNKRKNELKIAMMKIQIILAEANAVVYYDQMRERIVLEDAEVDQPSIEFKDFEYE